MLSSMRNAVGAVMILLLVMITTPIRVASFHSPSARRVGAIAPRSYTLLHNENPNKSEEEIVGDQYEGSVDWDAEWKKVVNEQDQPSQRPGKYKSEAEIAVIKATNKVAKNVYDASREAKKNIPSAPSIRSLQGDWKFWIGILLVVSFGLSILSATSPTNDSFYV